MQKLADIIKFDFSSEKNQQLIQDRKISFEEIIAALDNDKLLDVISHPNREKYPNQEILIVEIAGYVYLVPFVWKTREEIFLKTIFPSRKITKQYLSDQKE